MCVTDGVQQSVRTSTSCALAISDGHVKTLTWQLYQQQSINWLKIAIRRWCRHPLWRWLLRRNPTTLYVPWSCSSSIFGRCCSSNNPSICSTPLRLATSRWSVTTPIDNTHRLRGNNPPSISIGIVSIGIDLEQTPLIDNTHRSQTPSRWRYLSWQQLFLPIDPTTALIKVDMFPSFVQTTTVPFLFLFYFILPHWFKSTHCNKSISPKQPT